MTPEAGARELERMAGALTSEMEGVVRLSLLELLDIAREQSSGPLTEADLRRMDHPYARRHGSDRLNPNIVNRRIGNFYGGWEPGEVEDIGDAFVAELGNVSEEARYLAQEEGDAKTRMFGRHPEEAAADKEQPLFEERVDRALVRVMGG